MDDWRKECEDKAKNAWLGNDRARCIHCGSNSTHISRGDYGDAIVTWKCSDCGKEFLAPK